jgi:antitoxin FitA
MAQVLVRNLEDDTVERLRRRAESQGRSLEAELRLVLTEAASKTTPQEDLQRIRDLFGGRVFSDSVALTREDRDR